MNPYVVHMQLSIVQTWGEPMVMIWTIRDGAMVILSLEPISRYEDDEA